MAMMADAYGALCLSIFRNEKQLLLVTKVADEE